MLLVLGVVALASLKPGVDESLEPSLSVAPDIGAALGDATVVARPQPARQARLAVADARRPTLVAEPVAAPPQPPQAELAVSEGIPVASDGQGAKPPASPQPQPAPTPSPAPVAAPPPAPVPASTPPPLAAVNGGSPGSGPGTAVIDEFGPIEVCEGDEYALALLLYIETVLGEEATAETLAMRFEGEAGVGTVYIEGASIAVLDLVELLLAENGCLTIEIEVAAEAEMAGSPQAVEPALLPSVAD